MTTLSPRLEMIFGKTKAVCFGRFIIDVPATAVVVFDRMTVDFEVYHFSGEAGMIEKRINRQALNLEKKITFIRI